MQRAASNSTSIFSRHLRSHSVIVIYVFVFPFSFWQLQTILFIFPGSTVWQLFRYPGEWFNMRKPGHICLPPPENNTHENFTAFLVNFLLNLQRFLLWSPWVMSRHMEVNNLPFQSSLLGTCYFSFLLIRWREGKRSRIKPCYHDGREHHAPTLGATSEKRGMKFTILKVGPRVPLEETSH